MTVDWSLVTKLVRLDRWLGRLSKGWSRDLLDLFECASKMVSILSSCLPIVFKHWLVYLFCSMTFLMSGSVLVNLKGEAQRLDDQ